MAANAAGWPLTLTQEHSEEEKMEERANAPRQAVEDFATEHKLPPRWMELRESMRLLVEKPDFWYRGDLRDEARVLAGEASEILQSALDSAYKPRPIASKLAVPALAEKNAVAGTPPSKDERFMRQAIALARQAHEAGDTAVGSLVVRDLEIIAEGVESVKALMDISAHAELIAIREACWKMHSFDLSGCVLFTTAEPCYLCSYAIRRTGISTVVIGTRVPSVGGASSRHPILTDPAVTAWARPPKLIFGVLEQECLALRA